MDYYCAIVRRAWRIQRRKLRFSAVERAEINRVLAAVSILIVATPHWYLTGLGWNGVSPISIELCVQKLS
jgi:hypothetical protein